MKLTTVASLLLCLSTACGFRTQATKKQKKQHRFLQQTNVAPFANPDCYVDHSKARSQQEVPVWVKALPYTNDANALFKVKFQHDDYSPEEIIAYAWCIDLDRFIDTGDYSMDIMSAFDDTIRTDAVDRPENFKALSYLLNHYAIGDDWDEPGCSGKVGWTELQGAVWRTIDHNSWDESDNWYGHPHQECIAKAISDEALLMGSDYELDCADPDEQLPLVMIVDKGSNGKILNQVIVGETLLRELDGFCVCPTDAPTASPDETTPAPTDAPVGPPYTCPGTGTETAFAYPDDGDGCFLDDGFNRWGWTIDIDGEFTDSYTFDVYAAAGQCDLTKGEKVGTVTASYDKDTKTCTGEYNADSGYSISEFQFYCGPTKYPEQGNGSPTVGPGQYPCVHGTVPSPGTYDKCTIEGVEGTYLYVIAHAVSCGSVVSPETPAPTDAPETPAPTDVPVTPAPTDAPETPAPTDAPKTPAPTASPRNMPTPDKPKDVCIDAKILDFETDGDGEQTSAGDIATNLYATEGIIITSCVKKSNGQCNNNKPPMLFDSANPTGQDTDLASDVHGMILIISEDGDSTDPDDNAGGGTLSFDYSGAAPVCIESMVFFDMEDKTDIILYDEAGDVIDSLLAPIMSDGQSEEMYIGVCGVYKMDVVMTGSGAITGIQWCDDPTLLETPAPTDAPETPAPTDAPETPAPTDAPETPAPTDAPETPAPTDSPTELVCPADVYTCWDGSMVVRHSPDCEFEDCPPETPAPTDAPETPAPTDAPETPAPTDAPKTNAPTGAPRNMPTPDKTGAPTAMPTKGSGSGDPHFKTWLGEKYDYHGECDLVLVHNPSFMDGLGLRVHIRTTRIKYFSFIEKVGVQIGDDILEFSNDVDNFLINGKPAEAQRKHHKTMFGGFWLRRDPKAISIRIEDKGRKFHDGKAAKIDFHVRKNGFPAVIVDGGHTDIFKGSLGLLGDWATGQRIARDGKTVLDGEDATPFALEWQVRDDEPMLFSDARAPQFPAVCIPPAQMVGNRLGMARMKAEAEEACAHWKEDMDDCIFDVIATRDILVAEEGHIVHLS